MSWLSNIIEWFKRKPPVDWDTTGGEAAKVTVGDLVAAKEGQVGMPSHAVRQSQWERGWWLQARQMPAHRGRIGAAIIPKAVVVHTTDMAPGTFGALVRGWQKRPGAGNAAHF